MPLCRQTRQLDMVCDRASGVSGMGWAAVDPRICCAHRACREPISSVTRKGVLIFHTAASSGQRHVLPVVLESLWCHLTSAYAQRRPAGQRPFCLLLTPPARTLRTHHSLYVRGSAFLRTLFRRYIVLPVGWSGRRRRTDEKDGWCSRWRGIISGMRRRRLTR